MNGTVIDVRKMGVRVQMDAGETPTGNFNIISQSDGTTVVATVALWKDLGDNLYNMNWVGPEPRVLPRIGDTVRSA